MTLRTLKMTFSQLRLYGLRQYGCVGGFLLNSVRKPILGEKIEKHRVHRLRWLRSAVLGTNDGIVSTASLVLGVAAAGGAKQTVLIAGVAGLVSGAMSLASSEYVSASSQADTEHADLEMEREELAVEPEKEHAELAAIYVGRGLDAKLAADVADQLMQHDALGAHARDELGFSEGLIAHPIVTGTTAAVAFSIGAALPLVVVTWAPLSALIWAVSGTTLIFLALLGIVSARAGGASPIIAATRLILFGALAMAVTFSVGRLIGNVV